MEHASCYDCAMYGSSMCSHCHEEREPCVYVLPSPPQNEKCEKREIILTLFLITGFLIISMLFLYAGWNPGIPVPEEMVRYSSEYVTLGHYYMGRLLYFLGWVGIALSVFVCGLYILCHFDTQRTFVKENNNV